MKKLLLTLLLPLSIISSASYGEDLNSLFGITLYDNAEKYVSSNYIDSNKFKHDETIDGYFELTITDKIKIKSPFASYYSILIDNDNRVHRIYGDEHFDNLDICQAVRKDLLSRLEKKYQIDFEYWENSYPDFKIYSNYHYNYYKFAIQCREWYSDSSIKFQIYVLSQVLLKAIDEFYDAGL